MADVSIEVERLVREVLAELARAPKPETDKAACPSDGSKPSAGLAARDPRELVVGSRVVTLAEVGERLDGVRRLVVSPKAIVTPSVRDELRRMNIDLVLGSGEEIAAQPSSISGVVMLVHGKQIDVGSLVKALASDGIRVELNRSECILEGTELLARQLADGGTLGVLLTRYAAAGMCLANRRAGVRAILGIDVDHVADDAASVGANLLVVDPVRSGPFRTRQIVRQFHRQGVQECPKVFEKQLK